MENSVPESPKQIAVQETAEFAAHGLGTGAAHYQDTSFEWAARWKQAPRATSSPSTILFAEDDDDLRQVTTAILEMMGYVVVACTMRNEPWRLF